MNTISSRFMLCAFWAFCSIAMVGCATKSAVDAKTVADLERQAKDYQENGKIESAIETYRQCIAATPNHVKAVEAQMEILYATEALSDPWRSVEEMRNTASLFAAARDEKYEGATPEWIQKTQETIGDFILNQADIHAKVARETKNKVYFSFIWHGLDVYTTNFDAVNGACSKVYRSAHSAWEIESIVSKADYGVEWNEDYGDAIIRVFEWVLGHCETDNELIQGNYLGVEQAAHAAMLAYSSRNKHDDACPSKPPTNADEDTPNPPEYPIPECQQDFIRAARRFYDLVQKNEGSAPEDSLIREFAIDGLYDSARIYYEFSQFDMAMPILMEIYQKAPRTQEAILSAYLYLTCLGKRERYREMYDAIQKIKANEAFMEHKKSNTNFMPKFMEYLEDSERQLEEKRDKWE